MFYVYIEDNDGNTVLVNSNKVLDEISLDEINDYLLTTYRIIDFSYKQLAEKFWHGDFDLFKFFNIIGNKEEIKKFWKKFKYIYL